MAEDRLAEGVARDLPGNAEDATPPQSVEAIKEEMRHEMSNMTTNMDRALERLEKLFHMGMTELTNQVKQVKEAQGHTDVTDAPSPSRVTKPKRGPETEGPETEGPSSEDPESEEAENEVVTFARAEGTDESEQKFKGKLPEYKGEVPWEDYFAQVKIIKDARGWSYKETAIHIAASLRGPAITVLSGLGEMDRVNYVFLTEALERRFGRSYGPEVYRARLKARTRKRDEPLSHVAQDIEELVRRAFPSMSQIPMGVNDLAVPYFIDALNDRQLQLLVMQGRPRSLQAALTIAIEMESFLQTAVTTETSSRCPGNNYKSWRNNAGSTNPQPTSPRTPVVTVRPARLPRGPPRAGAERGGFEGECWRCGKKGHRRSECPELRNVGAEAPCGQGRQGWVERGRNAGQEAARAPPLPRPAGNGAARAGGAPVWPVRN